MGWPLGPGTPGLQTKGPGLKPNRFGHGFRGMNAPAPSAAAPAPAETVPGQTELLD